MIAPVEKYYKVTSWQGSGKRKTQRDVLLGYADDESGMIPYRLPDAPPADVYWVEPWDNRWQSVYPSKCKMSATFVPGWIKTKVFNHDKKDKAQKWTRDDTPEFWSPEFLKNRSEVFMKKKSGRNVPDPDHWRNPDNLTQEQYDYALLEWHRRIYGIWIMINGSLTWLSGFHYFYLQHFCIDIGYPEYRDRDRRWYYAWQACYDDPKCTGMVYLKHRRDGATYRAACIGLEIVTRGDMSGKHFGITSKGDDDAEELFNDKVRYPFDSMVEFFKPKLESGDSSNKQELIFNEPRVSASERYSSRKGLMAWIKTAAKSKKGKARWDGGKIHFGLNDEGGKRIDENIDNLYKLTVACLGQAGRDGKMLWPTTHEEFVGDNAERFEKMFHDADYSLKAASAMKVTKNGMFSYFTPAYDGINEEWIGEFGESIVEAPTSSQLDYLRSNEMWEMKNGEYWSKGWGAYEWWRAKCDDSDDPIGFLHQFPGTPEDAFRRTNPLTDMNTVRLAACRHELSQVQGNGKSLLENLVVRGNLYNVVKGDVKSDVYFQEEPNGRFLVNREYLPVYVGPDGVPIPDKGPGWGGRTALKLGLLANRVRRYPARQGYNESCGKMELASRDSRMVIGFDPQKLNLQDANKTKAKRKSSSSAHGFIPYDPRIDGPWDPDIPDFSRDWISHAWVFEYITKPLTTGASHIDIFNAAKFWSAAISYERQVNEFGNYMARIDCLDLMVKDPKGVAGWHSSQELIDIYVRNLMDWVQHHCYARRCPFLATMTQWADLNPADMEKFDAGVSSGMATLGWTRLDGIEAKLMRILPQSSVKAKVISASAWRQKMFS